LPGSLNLLSKKELTGNVELTLSNFLREKMNCQQLKYNAFEITVDVWSLKLGIYFLTLKEDALVIFYGRFVKG